MRSDDSERLDIARGLLADFGRRTGVISDGGDAGRRYLWTDAFAVQASLGLAAADDDASWREVAATLIAQVHRTLGRHRSDDPRQGWISGLPEDEGRLHPTAGGLRIGKERPERPPDEPFDDRLEWERDGQYFHYLTRWMSALLQAAEEFSEESYATWAAELAQAGSAFIAREAGGIRMYWKMSVDLSRPLVTGMGSHDPLDGLICLESILHRAPAHATALRPVGLALAELCSGRDWSTTDPLGIGGLLLNTARAFELTAAGVDLPHAARPEKLFDDSLRSLQAYTRIVTGRQSPLERLAFRDCGLSLGLRTLEALRHRGRSLLAEDRRLSRYMSLADDIESFWSDARHQESPTWTEHIDINSVTLAASLIALTAPPMIQTRA